MKQMLIIQPHWPPSNLVGVHRVRLIANELHHYGWHVTILAVDERDYEEELVPENIQLVAPEVKVVKVRARQAPSILGQRLFGDIALRAWKPLLSKAEDLLQKSRFDFVWFSLPSWYIALMGEPLLKRHGVQFGVDYRDPWIYNLAPNEKGLNRAMFTLLMARFLEPRALRKASIISGVSDGYIEGVRLRYAKQLSTTPLLTFQMGFSERDHFIPLPGFHVPFTPDKRTYVYAGAHWAMGAPLFSLFLKGLALAHHKNELTGVEFLFIGTGNPNLSSIQSQIEELRISEIAREIPERLSYLSVQKILRESNGTMVIGSTDAHYSASKIFQCLLTSPRLMGFFHDQSEGKKVLKECNAEKYYIAYNEHRSDEEILHEISQKVVNFVNPKDTWQADLSPLQMYTAKTNTKKFVTAINEVTQGPAS